MKPYFIILIFLLGAFATSAQEFHYAHVKTIGRAGSGPGEFNAAIGVAVKDGFWVVDQNNNRIQFLNRQGVYVREIKVPIGPAMAGMLDVEVDEEGNLLVSTVGGKGILKFSPTGNLLQVINADNSQGGHIVAAPGLTLDEGGNIYVADIAKRRIVKFDKNGTYNSHLKVTYDIGDLAVDNEQHIYATNITLDRGSVVKYDAAGTQLWELNEFNGLSLSSASGIKYNKTTGQLLVADLSNNRILVLNKEGRVVSSFSLVQPTGGAQPWPRDIDVDEANKLIYITDGSNNAGVQIWQYDIINGAEDPIAEQDLVIYPNPSHGHYSFSLGPFNSGKVIITVLDAQGRLVKQVQGNANLPIRLDLSTAAVGLYLAKINYGKKSLTHKLIRD